MYINECTLSLKRALDDIKVVFLVAEMNFMHLSLRLVINNKRKAVTIIKYLY